MTIVETDPELPVEPPAPEPEPHSGSQLAKWGLTTQDLLVLVAGAVFCVGVGPFEFGGWTLRMAALLAGLPLGVVVLARLARNRDKASVIASAFLVWAIIGALASRAPWRSILGQVDGNTQSVVIFLGVFGFWALARTLSERGRALVGPVLAGALGVSAFVAVLQVVLNITNGSLAHVGGRAAGLEGNAALYSATLCGAWAWCASVSESSASARYRSYALGAVVFFAVGIGLSGTRVSIIAIGIASIAICLRARSVRSIRVPILGVVGLATSLLMQHVFLPTDVTPGASSVDRFSSVGTEGRIELWKAALSAFRERPLIGWGVGRVRPAMQHHFTPDFVRLYQFDDFTHAWNDAHNVIVQMLVSVGIVGLVLLAVFVVLAVRKGDFGLALAAGAISVNWLLQPSSLSSLAVAAVFLGAAANRLELTPTSRGPRVATALAATLGLCAALALVAADLNLKQAVQTADSAKMRAAASWFGDDPFVIDTFFVGTYKANDPSQALARVAAARRAVAAEPDVPLWWNELAMTQWDTQDFEGMRESVEKALELQPNHVRSWVQLTAYAKHVGDVELEATARKHACDLGAPVCQPG